MNLIKSLLLTAVLLNFSCSKAQQQESSVTKKQEITNPIIIGSKIKLYSEILVEDRELLISLPENYNQQIQDYPIVFVMDADHMTMFELTRAITNALAKTDFMPGSIIVGLTNNGNLNNRYQMTSGSERNPGFYENKAPDYLHFLENVVVPYMEANYRVANHKTIIGLSPSNGPLYEAIYKESKIFDAYVFLAADLYFRYSKTQSRGNKLMEHLKNPSYPKATIYLGIGGNDVADFPSWGEQFKNYESQMKEIVDSKISYKFDLIESEGHYEMASKGLKNAFKLIYPNEIWNRQNSYHLERGERPIDLKKHFDKLSAHYGFEIFPSESKLEHQTRALLRWGNTNNIKTAISLLTQGVIYYPNSASLHLLLAEGFQKNNQQNYANEYFKKSRVLAFTFPPKNYSWFAEKIKELDNK